MKFQEMFASQGFAATYVRLAERFTEPGAARLLRFSGLAEETRPVRVFDSATGPGLVPLLLFSPPEHYRDLKTSAEIQLDAGDLSDEMVTFASKRGEYKGWPGSFKAFKADGVDTKLPDDEYDYVLCSFGVQSMPDHVKALQECLRITKPGGVVAVNFWERVFWLPIVAAAAKQSGAFEVLPKMFDFDKTGARERVESVAKDAGWKKIEIDRHAWDISFDSTSHFLECAGTMLPAALGVPASDTEKIPKAKAAIEAYVDAEYKGKSFSVPAACITVKGTK